MKSFFKIVSALIAVIFICTSFSACGKIGLGSSKEEKTIVMTVDGYEVPFELYRYFVLNYKAQYELEEGESLSDADVEAIREKTEASIKELYAIISLAKDFEVDESNKTVASAIDAALKAEKNAYDNNADYVRALAEGYMTHNVYELLQTNIICADELYYKMMNDGAIKCDEEFLHDYIYGDGFIRVKQILIMGESSRKAYGDMILSAETSHTDEEAAALAEIAMNKAKAGEDFDALVREYGESLFMFSNIDGYYICEGAWDDVNSDAAFALEIGDVSDVIVSDKGYSVFKRYEKDEEYIKKNYQDLCDTYTKAQYSLAVEKRLSELKLEKTEAYGEISIKDMEWN
ncbi:MAG: peptidyl-prolyl cis-trans isomerase [Clostridia bacterium]|nr:peptidyl-prolyl cis-trans isomerase [Clostridia bacterium]